MNRPIKFRVWDGVVPNMYYSYKHIEFDKHGNVTALHIVDEEDPTCFLTIRSPNFVLMQFTGVHDKNGKEIWEGDIVRDFSFFNNLVKFGRFEFENEKGGVDEFIGWYREYCPKEHIVSSLSASDSKHIEVIGNVYENRELLGDEK